MKKFDTYLGTFVGASERETLWKLAVVISEGGYRREARVMLKPLDGSSFDDQPAYQAALIQRASMTKEVKQPWPDYFKMPGSALVEAVGLDGRAIRPTITKPVFVHDDSRAKCSRCGASRFVSELNGWNPLNGDFSKAYCRSLASCNSLQARATMKRAAVAFGGDPCGADSPLPIETSGAGC